MSSFEKISASYLESIATGSERIPTLYFEGNVLTRELFWLRLSWLHQLAVLCVPSKRTVLDFGSGGGAFLPSLARLFSKVVAFDLETQEASQVIAHYELDNVTLVQGDVRDEPSLDAPFDAIIAADVLEHFEDLEVPVEFLRSALGANGVLLTSLPTENFLYRVLRSCFGVEKPADHFHTSSEVESYLSTRGFHRIRQWYIPFRIQVLPLFVLTAWGRDPA